MKKGIISLVFIVILLMFIVTVSGHATTISYKATVDNTLYMFISTSPTVQGTQIGYGNNWTTTYSGSAILTPGITQYLQVYGINTGGPAGFIGDFTLSDSNFKFANGTQSLLTNTSDWFVSETGFGIGPNLVTGFGANGVSPWSTRSGISTSAQWIWTNNYYGAFAYISTPITAAVPLPSAILLLGPGLIGLATIRKRFKK
jgi:hypothetical protein